MQHYAGIELAATGPHWQPIERGKPHRRCDRNPVPQRASRAAVTEMCHDYPATSDFGRTFRQNRGDVFIRKAVKAVAPDALLIERVGQRKGLLDLGSGAVEGGI